MKSLFDLLLSFHLCPYVIFCTASKVCVRSVCV